MKRLGHSFARRTSFHSTLLHRGMVIVGGPYACKGLTNMKGITGGSAYGALTLAGSDGSRQPSAKALEIAQYEGRHVAELAGEIGAVRRGGRRYLRLRVNRKFGGESAS